MLEIIDKIPKSFFKWIKYKIGYPSDSLKINLFNLFEAKYFYFP